MRRPTTLIALTTASLAISPAAAQQSGGMARAEVEADLNAQFRIFDASGDGRFDKTEFLAARTKAMQETEAKLKQRLPEEFADLDANKDQFLTAAEITAKVPVPGAAKQTIAKLDKNKDSKISRTEYVSQKITVEAVADVDRQIKNWDQNGDNIVTRDEFVGGALARFDSMDANKDKVLSETEAAPKSSMPQGR